MSRFFIPLAILGLTAATPALAADVVVDLSGVEAASGDLFVSLQSKDQFLKPAGTYGTIVKAPKAGAHSLTIKDVAPGDYSVSVWHDIDGDKRFSMGPDGMPADGWSMLHAEKLRGMPQWDEVRFSVAATPATKVTLAMIYAKPVKGDARQ